MGSIPDQGPRKIPHTLAQPKGRKKKEYILYDSVELNILDKINLQRQISNFHGVEVSYRILTAKVVKETLRWREVVYLNWGGINNYTGVCIYLTYYFKVDAFLLHINYTSTKWFLRQYYIFIAKRNSRKFILKLQIFIRFTHTHTQTYLLLIMYWIFLKNRFLVRKFINVPQLTCFSFCNTHSLLCNT